MSLAGRPKTVARKARANAVAKARTRYQQEATRIHSELGKILEGQLAPHRAELAAEIRKADISYFEAIGDTESVRLLKKAA